MTRATTPTLICTLPKTVNLTQAQRVYVTVCQGSKRVTVSDSSLRVTENTVEVYLNQSQTVLFTPGQADIQVNWTYAGGDRACSKIVTIPVRQNLLPEVLV